MLDVWQRIKCFSSSVRPLFVGQIRFIFLAFTVVVLERRQILLSVLSTFLE
jgi:hypothetical protein